MCIATSSSWSQDPDCRTREANASLSRDDRRQRVQQSEGLSEGVDFTGGSEGGRCVRFGNGIVIVVLVHSFGCRLFVKTRDKFT